jgi:hypothetical protein
MPMHGTWSILVLLCAAFVLSGDPDSPEALVRSLYDEVSFGAGQTPDWDKVRSMFIEEAVIVLRTSREKTTRFDLEGFVDDFEKFAGGPKVQASGFEEKVLRTRTTVFREFAHVLVLYEAHVPGSPRPPQKGIDSFHLVREDGKWRIVSILNDIPTEDHPVPDELKE